MQDENGKQNVAKVINNHFGIVLLMCVKVVLNASKLAVIKNYLVNVKDNSKYISIH